LTKLPSCCVIRIPFDFLDGDGPHAKRFLVIGHVATAAISLKATSKTALFKARYNSLDGVVVCPPGGCFEQETIIDPANAFAISLRDLLRYDNNGDLEILCFLPELREQLNYCHKSEPQDRAVPQNWNAPMFGLRADQLPPPPH
jgi:hypothetical protein